MRSSVLIVGLMACQGEVSSSPFEPANLERATVTLANPDALEGNRRDWSGDLRIEAGEQDYEIVVQSSAGNQTLMVHSSGRSDLTTLESVTDARVSVARDLGADELSVAVSEASDALLYLIEPVRAGVLTVEWFGQGLVAEGEDLGEVSVDGFDVSFTSALFRTDSGDVELLPGEPQEVVVEGGTFRVVLLTSHTSRYTLGSAEGCTGVDARVAFEMLRVEPGAADLTPIVRAEGVDLPLRQCAPAAE